MARALETQKQLPVEPPKVFSEPSIGTDSRFNRQAPSGHEQTNGIVTPSPAVHGKLYFTKPGGGSLENSGSCSASVVNSDGRDTILTAAHCVVPARSQNFYSNFAFVPAYYDGSRPHGTWAAEEVRVTSEWTTSGNSAFDYASIRLLPRDGQEIVDTVGGNGLVLNHGNSAPDTHLWAWPGNSPWNAERSGLCVGDAVANTTTQGLTTDAWLPCRMQKGASGGGFVKDVGANQLGYLYAAASRCQLGYFIGIPLGCNNRGIYATPYTSAAIEPLMAP